MNDIIFITGTGRCGTNILRDSLSHHPKIFSFPFELRFLIDPDGIVDFYTTFPMIWSPYMADIKLERLERILRDVSDKNIERYKGWGLSEHFPSFPINDLMEKLKDFTFRSSWVRNEKDYQHFSSYKSKDQLKNIFQEFLDGIITDLLEEKQKDIFCTDETWAYLYAEQLYELFPRSKFIYMYRDPRDTVVSFMNQKWCPDDLYQATAYYESLESRWNVIKHTIPSNVYIELSLENLVNNTELEIKRLCDFLNIDYYSKYSLEKVINRKEAHSDKWKKELNDDQIIWLDKKLKVITKELGYG
jgi:hypothetical protein